jgi:hypothetical protein
MSTKGKSNSSSGSLLGEAGEPRHLVVRREAGRGEAQPLGAGEFRHDEQAGARGTRLGYARLDPGGPGGEAGERRLEGGR